MGKPNSQKIEKARKKAKAQAVKAKERKKIKKIIGSRPKLKWGKARLTIKPEFEKLMDEKLCNLDQQLDVTSQKLHLILERTRKKENEEVIDLLQEYATKDPLADIIMLHHSEKAKHDVEQELKITRIIGEFIFSQLSAQERKWFPFHFFTVGYKEGGIRVAISKMHSASGSSGRNYLPGTKRTINGKKIAFSRHALDQIYARLSQGNENWVGLSNTLLALHSNATLYQFVRMPREEPAFSIIAPFTKDFAWNWKHLVKFNPNKEYGVRLGYCPYVIDGDFARAITFLVPGFKGTPEENILQTLRQADQDALNQSTPAYYENFHKYVQAFQSAIPQVIEIGR
jgi:hypothetical protein